MLLLVCALLWSLSGTLIKLLNAGGGGVPAVTIACSRSILGGAALLPLALRRRRSLRHSSPAWMAGSVLTFTAMTATFVVATTLTAAANAILLQYTAPLWVFLLSPLLLGERPRRNEGLVLLVAMAGVAIIFAGNRSGGAVGLAVALASGVAYGALMVVLRAVRKVDPTVVTCVNLLGSGLLLLPAVAHWGVFSPTGRQIGLLVAMSLVQFALPYWLFSYALRYVEAYRASLIVLIEAVLNPLWTYLFIGEAVPRATWIGGPLILAGVAAWIAATARREEAPEAVRE